MIHYNGLVRLLLLLYIISRFYIGYQQRSRFYGGLVLQFLIVYFCLYDECMWVFLVYFLGLIFIKKVTYRFESNGFYDLFTSVLFIHLFVLFLMWDSQGYFLHKNVEHVCLLLDIDFNFMIQCLIQILLVIKPANMFIKYFLKNDKEVHSDAEINYGMKIGVCERVIILLCFYLQDYASIGLILTAKSIVRFDQISNSKEFAEYYLFGTFLSMLFVLVTVCIFI